jgi:CHAD domain-containing protein
MQSPGVAAQQPPPPRRRAWAGPRPLVAQHQLTTSTGGHDARAVGVAATARVAFGSDQHVLAERRQMTSAKRAAIRRGLGAARPAHRPPRGLWKLRHAPILAPLGGALAIVGAGAGVAVLLARRGRHQAATETDVHPQEEGTVRDPVPASPGGAADTPGEPGTGSAPTDAPEQPVPREAGQPRAPRDKLTATALAQFDLAIELLQQRPAARPEERPEETVHETRKTLKRLRALMRLRREQLGAKQFARENTALRDAGRQLAGARDTEVMVDALDALLARHPKRLSRSGAAARLRATLVADRERSALLAVGDVEAHKRVLSILRAARARVAEWNFKDDERKRKDRGAASLRACLARLYGEGRERRRVALNAGSSEALHDWRKRVKDLRYAAELLDHDDRGGRRLRRVARAADRLGELLGEEHDLAMLAERVRAEKACFDGERATHKDVLRLIAKRRRRLRREALGLGEHLYRLGPRKFARRVGP